MWKVFIVTCIVSASFVNSNDDFYRIKRTDGNGDSNSNGFLFPFEGIGFAGNAWPNEELFTQFFRNFETSLKEAFANNLANQRAALQAGQKALQMTTHSNENPSVASRFGSDDSVPQSAYAGAYLGPTGTRQVAAINPGNPNMPNIDMTSSRNGGNGGGNNFFSVSSSSFSSSGMDPSGRTINSKGARTVVNDNGQVKEYSIHS